MELERLRAQVAELTQRVFRLEQLLEGGASAGYTAEAALYPTMQLDRLGEPTPVATESPRPDTGTESILLTLEPEPPEAPKNAVSVQEPGSTTAEWMPSLDAPPPIPLASPEQPSVVQEDRRASDMRTLASPPGSPNPPEVASLPKPASLPKLASLLQPPNEPNVVNPPNVASPARRLTSLEIRVGGQWLNRVGIVAVLVGLSYFLKLAFDNNWIGPPVRVGVGIAIGIGLLLWSERFRSRGFVAFAYSLKAIGIGALYLSLWAASQFYYLVPATVAFAGMVLVTVTAAALSLRQNSELLAAFALVGGFLTPVLVSSHQNQELELFCYVALLDLGTLWIVVIKQWPRILLASFVGTALLFAGWAYPYYTDPQLLLTFCFASVFFLLFAAAPLFLRRLRAGVESASVVLLALANAATYFAASVAMLVDHHRQDLAWLCAATAFTYFALVPAARQQEKTIKLPLGPLYLALAIGFFTIAIPLELDRHWITLGWIVESAALIWAAHRIDSLLVRVLAVCSLGMGVARLILLESDVSAPPLINARFGLYLLAIAALGLMAYFAVQEDGKASRQWAGGAIICMNLLALLALHFEVTSYFEPQLDAVAVTRDQQQDVLTLFDFTYSAAWMFYGGLLMLIGFWRRSAFLRWQAIVLLALTVAKVFFSDIHMLQRLYRITAFIVLGVILLVVSYFYQRNRAKAAT